ncbi:MAG: hypothetical protein ABSH52_03440 [Terriglobia bacterium]|jgi:hypothetical protein
MNIRPGHLSALCHLGYTETEARFLYLVATHSGYFTLRHYLAFCGQSKGCLVHRLTSRILDRRHARYTPYAHNTHVYNLYSRRVYGVIDKDNLRNRRRQAVEMIHARLMTLAFVVAHSDEGYLETEREKVDYFTGRMRIPLAVLPCRIYHGIKSASKTKRYFVDRSPIFIPATGSSLGLPPLVTFTYCDIPGSSLRAYMSHLHSYKPLLRQLPDFNFVFASAEPYNFERAKAHFSQQFGDSSWFTTRRLLRYFQLRRLWETQRSAELTRADRDFLRDAMKQFRAAAFESAYQKWANGGLSNEEARSLLALSETQKKGRFQTYVLPESYSIFSTEARTDYRTRGRDRSSGQFSISRSTPCEP